MKTKNKIKTLRLGAASSPESGESKQDFLGRCVRKCREKGMPETQAMGICASDWNRARLSDFIDNGQIFLTGREMAVTLAESKDNEPRRFSMLGYTGKLIDFGYWGRFVIDLQGMKSAKGKMPALRQHDVSQIVGTIESTEATNAGFTASGIFSASTQAGKEVLGLADEGFPWQASIGVQGTKILEVGAGEKHQVNGQTIEGPVDVWLESEVFEISFVPFGADDDTAAVSMTAQTPNNGTGPEKQNGQEEVMNKKLRKILEKLGLDVNATDEEAKAFLEGLPEEKLARLALQKDDGFQIVGTIESTEGTKKELSASEVLELQSRAASLGLEPEKVSTLITANMQMSPADLTVKMVEMAAADNPPSVPGTVDGGRTELEKISLAAEHAIAMRCGVNLEKPEPGAQQLRGLSLRELGREYLSHAGLTTRGMSNNQVAKALLASTSDFPAVMANVADKIAQKAYQEAPSTYQAWCSIADSNDFKPSDRPQLSESPDLELITEDGEYRHGSFSDLKETNQVKTYGRAFRITRQGIINDDLGMLTRIPRAFGQAGIRRINDLVYAKLTGPQTMAYDSKALFHADHNNLLTGTGLTSSTLGNARAKMRLQKGPGGTRLNLEAMYLLVPAMMEMTADVILRSAALPDDEKSSGVYNPHQNKLIPIVEARLDDTSSAHWYLIANHNQIETVEVVFLDGIRVPVVEETEVRNVDGREFLVRIDVGVRALDHRGLLKNAG